MTITLGIDLGSQPATTAACLMRWEPGTATVLDLGLGLDDKALLGLARDADKVGIDAPFGWPAAFVSLVHDHLHLAGNASVEPWTNDRRDQLRFRRTDHVVRRELGRWPLSVSSDLIVLPAIRCIGLLHQLNIRDRSGDDRAVEVYPAVALHRWQIDCRGYKRPAATPLRARMLDQIAQRCPGLNLPPEIREACARNDHTLDALVAAIVDRAYARQLTHRPGADDQPLAAIEGWTAIPTDDALARLTTAV